MPAAANRPEGPEPKRSRPSLLGAVLRTFLRGLAAILPLALTGYLVYQAVVAGETLLRSVVLLVVDERYYWPGMGFALSVGLVLVIGLAMYSLLLRTVYRRLTHLLERIPVVKSVYGMIVDVVRLFASSEERPFRRVVLVTLPGDLELIGFVTREDFADHPEFGERKVAVYLPMSYQLGGFTVVVPGDKVRDVDMSVEEALRFCVTAGVARREDDD